MEWFPYFELNSSIASAFALEMGRKCLKAMKNVTLQNRNNYHKHLVILMLWVKIGAEKTITANPSKGGDAKLQGLPLWKHNHGSQAAEVKMHKA